MTTLKDIATRAGVSTCTVSKILGAGSGHERYSAGCQSRVRAAAQALGFVPNHAARALRTGATGIVAFAVDWAPEGAGNAFQAAMISACEAAARTRGLHLLVVGTRGGLPTDPPTTTATARPPSAVRAALELAERRQCDGIVIPGGKLSRGDLDALRGRDGRIAVSFLGQVPGGCAGAELDDGAGVAAAVRHLAGLGHRRLAWVETAARERQALRRAAFTAACEGLGLDARVLSIPVYPAAGDESHVAHARAALLARHAEIADRTAFVCYHDLLALGVYAALHELGRSVPRYASVVGFDNVHAATALPAMTTVDHELPALAEAAMAALSSPNDDSGSGTDQDRGVLIAPRLIIRASTAPAPSR